MVRPPWTTRFISTRWKCSRSPATGILYPHVERGEEVRKGALLAHITDFFGEPVADVVAPFEGVVLYVVATPPISKGQPVACVGQARA